MNEKKNGYTKELQNVYNFRLKNYAVQALKDLTLLAEKLPEDQQGQIFNEKHLAGLIRVLFKFPPAVDREDFLNPSEEVLDRIDRLLPLCFETTTCLNDSNFAGRIAPHFWEAFRHLRDELGCLRAVYYRSLDQTPHKKYRKTK